MIVVDVETGGLNPEINPILSVGAVDFDNPQNQFYGEMKPYRGMICNIKAMQVNGINLREWNSKPSMEEVMKKFNEWVNRIRDKTLAGMNPAFDRDFCNVNFERIGLRCVFNHRTIDLHSVAYASFKKRDLPFEAGKLYTDQIYKILGMPDEPKPHNALTGAKMEAEAFGRLILNRRLELIQ